MGEDTQRRTNGRLDIEFDRVASRLAAEGGLSMQSRPRVLGVVDRFRCFVSRAFGLESLAATTPRHVEAFARSTGANGQPPSVATMRLRRSSLRLLLRTARELGLVEGDPTVDLVLPSRTNEVA